jgi:hypothetical protein
MRERQILVKKSRMAVVATALFTCAVSGSLSRAVAGPSPEVARKCMRFSYIAYPYKRPGSVKMSGDRQSYFRDCMAKEGNIPAPTPSQAS